MANAVKLKCKTWFPAAPLLIYRGEGINPSPNHDFMYISKWITEQANRKKTS
jgi:hypothetical protein